jgi:hypothetical protein
MQSWPSLGPPLVGRELRTRPNFDSTKSEQPAGHSRHADCDMASAFPPHLVRFSESAPVGQVSTQAPQNTHPLSSSGLSKAVPMVASLLRWVKAMALSPRSSSQTRTQRPQRMQML